MRKRTDPDKNQFAFPVPEGALVRIDGRWMKVRGVIEPRAFAEEKPVPFLAFVEADRAPRLTWRERLRRLFLIDRPHVIRIG